MNLKSFIGCLLLLFLVLQTSIGFGQEKKSPSEVKAELDLFEKDQYNRLLARVGKGSQTLLEKLNASEEQREKFTQFRKWLSEQQTAINKTRSDLIVALQTGGLPAERYTKEKSKLDKQWKELGESFVSKVEERLIPFQTKELKRIAHLARLIKESDFGDEFGVALVILKGEDFSEEEINRVKNAIIEARLDFYSALKREREKANKRVLSSASVEFRKAYLKKYPKWYDYKSEIVKSVEFPNKSIEVVNK